MLRKVLRAYTTGLLPRSPSCLPGLSIALAVAVAGVHAGSLIERRHFGPNPGNLGMFTYIPDGLRAGRPLVVALHGCTQRAADFDDETGWVALAERWRFALLLPQQSGFNNQLLCFNWFNGEHRIYDWLLWLTDRGNDIERGKGEALSVRSMIARMADLYAFDPDRVFITGVSAGGSLTVVMLATYPEIFAGGAALAAVPYKCATYSGAALFDCGADYTLSGAGAIRDLTPAQWGDKVRNASAHSGPWPRLSIWHGEDDPILSPESAHELMEQWTDVHGIDAVPDVEETVNGHRHRIYRDARGEALVETYAVSDLGHAYPIDPGAGPRQCGIPARFVEDADICASYFIGRFWGLDRSPEATPGSRAEGFLVSSPEAAVEAAPSPPPSTRKTVPVDVLSSSLQDGVISDWIQSTIPATDGLK